MCKFITEKCIKTLHKVVYFTVDSSEWRFYYCVDEYEVCAVCYGLISSYLVLEKNHAAREATQSIGKVLFSLMSQKRRDLKE